MAFGFRTASGVNYGLRTDTTFSAPSGLSNDDILLVVMHSQKDGVSTPPTTPTPPSGFSAVDTFINFSSGADRGELAVWWKRASSESGGYTFTHPSQTSCGFLLAITGCVTSGSPIDAHSKNNGTGSTSTGTGISMSAANQLLVMLSNGWDGFSFGTPTGMTVRASGGSNATIIYSQDIAASGATGNRTHSNPNGSGSPWASWMLGLKAAPDPSRRLAPVANNAAVMRAASW